MKKAEITYLWNSGFAVELEKCVLIFDYYQDAAKAVPGLLKGKNKAYVFASHAHFDHFSPDIAGFASDVTRYFLSEDIQGLKGTKEIPEEKRVYLSTYDAYEDSDVKVTSYSSTDQGTSFLVEVDGWKIFHAGDFNWWHWKEDTAENISLARNGFQKQMKRLDGLEADIAFFPVDLRMQEFASCGAKEFCQRTKVDYLITMHNTTQVPWRIEPDFFALGQEIPVWIPALPGEIKTIQK